MSIGSYIEKVAYGTSRRFDCPSCNGKNTLSVSKEGSRALYHCYKNSCVLHTGGSRILKLTGDELKESLKTKIALGGRTAAKSDFRLPDYWIPGLASKKAFQMLLNSNAIEAYTSGMFKVAYDPKLDRLVYLVQDATGRTVGGVGRALNGQHPKTYNYPDSAAIPFTCGKGGTAVIVEDCASACSIARFDNYTGVALLGTHLKAEYLFYVMSKFSNIIIALDPDAYAKSFKMKESIKYYTDNVLVWRLPRDFKNMTKDEINQFIQLNRTPII